MLFNKDLKRKHNLIRFLFIFVQILIYVRDEGTEKLIILRRP